RAVVPLMCGEGMAGLRGRVVHELIALAFGHTIRAGSRLAGRRAGLKPGLASVIGALNDLSEPSAGLRGVESIRVRQRTLDVINLPAGKVRATHVPLLAFAVRSQYECALARANQYSYSAHFLLLLTSNEAASRACPDHSDLRA